MKMKRIVFLLLSIAMLGMWGCNDEPGENIQLGESVAILGYSSELQEYTLLIPGVSGMPAQILLAPELSTIILTNSNISLGDAVLAVFHINFDQQPTPGYTTVINLGIFPIETSEPWRTYGSGSSGFDTPIVSMDDFENQPYCEIIKHQGKIVFFFLFWHTVTPSENIAFYYEMTYDIDEDAAIQSAYIRAKVTNEGSVGEQMTGFNHHAFDMTYFFQELEEYSKTTFRIFYNEGGEEESFKLLKEFEIE